MVTDAAVKSDTFITCGLLFSSVRAHASNHKQTDCLNLIDVKLTGSDGLCRIGNA